MLFHYAMNPIKREIWGAYQTARRSSKGYANDPIACVYPRIYVGAGCQLTRDFAKRYSITHVINCAEPSDCPSWWQTEHPAEYRVLYAKDDPRAQILNWYPEFERAMTDFLQDPACTGVFVHCQCGINRSAFLTLAFLVDHYHFPWEETTRALIEQRPCCLTNPSYWFQIKNFAKSRASKHGIPQPVVGETDERRIPDHGTVV